MAKNTKLDLELDLSRINRRISELEGYEGNGGYENDYDYEREELLKTKDKIERQLGRK